MSFVTRINVLVSLCAVFGTMDSVTNGALGDTNWNHCIAVIRAGILPAEDKSAKRHPERRGSSRWGNKLPDVH
jgi:hypothetical protein